MTKVIFIGATGTDIGKTYVTCLLIRQLLSEGYNVHAIKPVISGIDETNLAQSDSGLILKALGKPVTAEQAKLISPWQYEDPLPPHLAAQQAGQPINFDQLVNFCQNQMKEDIDYLLIEGVGGVMVPLSEQVTTLDLMEQLNCSCLIVAGSYLGTLSHTLTSISCIRQKNIRLAGLVVSESLQNYADFDVVFKDFTKLLPEVSLCQLGRNNLSQNILPLIIPE